MVATGKGVGSTGSGSARFADLFLYAPSVGGIDEWLGVSGAGGSRDNTGSTAPDTSDAVKTVANSCARP